MNFVNLCFLAVGEYSGATYKKNVLVSEEFYRNIEGEIKKLEMEICVPELDGEGTVGWGEIYVQPCGEENLPKWYTDEFDMDDWFKDDGGIFKSKLDSLCKKLGLDLNLEEKRVRKYLETVDYNIYVTVSIKRKQKDILLKFVESLKE